MKKLQESRLVEIERTPKTTKRYQIKYLDKKKKLKPVNDNKYKHHVAVKRLKRFQKRFNQKLQIVEVE